MCEAFNKTPVTKTLLGEVHKLLRMYLMLPVASATSELTFSALRRLKNYLGSTMKQDRLNNCLLIHCHKLITDTLDTVKIAKRFTCANEQHKGLYAWLGEWVKDEPPPPPPPPPPTFQNAPPPQLLVVNFFGLLKSRTLKKLK